MSLDKETLDSSVASDFAHLRSVAKPDVSCGYGLSPKSSIKGIFFAS